MPSGPYTGLRVHWSSVVITIIPKSIYKDSYKPSKRDYIRCHTSVGHGNGYERDSPPESTNVQQDSGHDASPMAQ